MAEKQEFYKLINDKTKVPRLTPLPQIDFSKNDHLEKNPLQKFRAQAMKFVKPKPQQPKITDKWRSSVNRISKSLYQEELIKLAKTIRVQGLLPEWEGNILKLIPKTSKRKHIMFLMSIMKEVKQDYLKEMQSLSVKSIVNIEEKKPDEKVGENQSIETVSTKDSLLSFDTNRKLISKKYFLSHRLIRSISNIMYYNLPKCFINFERYKSFADVHISKLNETINHELQRCSLTIQNQCYNEIIRYMLQLNHIKADKRLPRLLHCAESFMVQQILNSMMNTITTFIETLRGSGSCAQLKLRLLCRNDVVEVEPSVDEIFTVYHGVIESVKSIGQELVPLAEWLKISEKTEYIKVSMPDWFVDKAHAELQLVLDDNYASLRRHYEFVSERFGLLCSGKTRRQISRLVASRKGFDLYFEQVDKFNGYLKEVNAMPASIYYRFGGLDQTLAIRDLKQHAADVVSVLVNEITAGHQELNRSICLEFENLESRALAIPDDTKSLFELTDYVSYASKVLIKQLEEKIQKSIGVLSRLLQISVLSSEHVELNKTTINWLELIKPVFSQHNIFCEAKKGELEDELQRKVNVLTAEIDAIFPNLVVLNDMDDAKRVAEYKEFLVAILNRIKQVDNQIGLINNEEKLFKFPETTFPKVDELKELMGSFCSLIHIISQWKRNYEVWMDGPFEYLNAQLIREKTESYLEQVTEMHKMYKVKIKSDLTANKPFKFAGIVDDPDPLQQPAPLKLCWVTMQDLNKFKNYIPLAICMCNPALEKRHWAEMSTIAGINLLPNAGTTLRKIIDLDLLRDYKEYEIISIGANNELALHKKLIAMIKNWNDIKFTVNPDEKSKLLKFADEERIEILLEEQFIEIVKMRASHFITPIESKVVDFYKKLCYVRDVIELWNTVQEQYKYLDPFLKNTTVREHFETEVDLYESLNVILMSIKEALSADPTFEFLTKSESVLEKLEKSKYAFDLIKAKVHDYFESLRLSFTRLFFVSDREIFKLLFERQYVTQKTSYLQKCFPSIARVKMDKRFNIFSIIGEDGEELILQKFVSTVSRFDSAVDWLINLNNEVHSLIKCNIDESVETFNDEVSLSWISSNPAMVTFCIWQIIWTTQIHGCFLLLNAEALKTCRNRFNEYKESAQQILKRNLSRKDRETITSLIILFIHQEEIINCLIDKKVHDDNDFDWKAQIRYYYQEEQVKVCIINTCVSYAYEYYNSSQRILVNTPLTERCYRSVMEAKNQNLFGEIVGHSCTGKTETIKNLSRILAVPFFMFSGDITRDYSSVIKLLKGLVTFECWVHVKNFTRIKEEILSIVAQYVFRISQCKSMTSNSINIDGTQLLFNPNHHLSFSVNPTLTKLSNVPDNLRLHFRRVSFMNPDIEKIFQVELFANGFKDAKNLSILLADVYNLCNEQMSSKAGYDLKLRNMKCVISAAAKLKFTFPNEEEQVLLLRSLVDVNLSQFAENDIIIFQNILNASFSGAALPSPNYDNLLEAVEQICANKRLSNHDIFKLKVIQLYEMIHLRKSIILVGDAFSGKSTILQVFKEALVLMQNHDNQDENFNISCEVINPCALSVDALFGRSDETTGNWKDGVASEILRRYSESDNSTCKWLIFDGNMHSLWTERLENVLDDNRTLCLTSNERIMFTQEIQIFFETLTLQDALPSTISRCGIVHVDLQSLSWRPYLLADILSIDQFQGHEKLIYTLFDWTIDPCLEFIRNECTVSLLLTDMHLVMSTLDLFKMYMNYAIEENSEKKDDPRDNIAVWSQAAIVMATNWALAGTLDLDSKLRFEKFYAALWKNTNEKYPRPAEIKQLDVSLPTEGRLQDNIYMLKGSGGWKNCAEIVRTEKIKEDLLSRDIFIPTVDSVKLAMLFNLHLKNQKPFILCGENSSGKTSFFRDYFANLSSSEFIANFFNFNYLTEADEAKKLFLSKLNKIKRYNYEPPRNKSCIHLIDDFNTVSNIQSNVNSTLELIRQLMDYGYWHDSNSFNKVIVKNVLFGAVLTTRNQKVNNVCSRFLRHFNVFTMHSPSRDNTFRIFSNVLLTDLKKNSFSADIMNSINSIINATIEIYLAITQDLRPTPTKQLYNFSTRDINRITKGCGLICKESVETKVTFIRLWAHETFRVLGDRMVVDEDRRWLFAKIKEITKQFFKDPFESVFDYLPKHGTDELTVESFSNLVFGNFMDADKSKRRYEEINNFENLKNKCCQYLKEFNENNKRKLDIVVTCHAIQHLVRINRVLATSGESLLMISSSGSGRKSLTRLATYSQQQNLFEPVIDTQYDECTWREDIKSIMTNCGTLKKEYAFLMIDRQMRPEFLRDINSLLSFGEIPQLFNDDEQREIVKKVRIDAQSGDRNLELDIVSVFNYFLYRCRQRLHFFINLSPGGEILQDCIRNYPAIVNQCTIDWLDHCPDKALEQVATHYLKDLNIQDIVKSQVVVGSKHFYTRIRQLSARYYQETRKEIHVVPASFARTAKLYVSIMSRKQEEIKASRRRYLSGLDKLQLAAREVAQMKSTLTKLRPQLEASARQTEETMKEIENENVSVERATVLVKRDEEIANKKAEIAGVLKAECEAELAVAIPILEDALAALNTLKPTDITLVKAMKNPPDTIKLVMAAVCVMLNVSSERVVDPVTGRKTMDYWGPSKKVLGDMNFLQNLKDYDKDNISPAIITTIKKTYMPDKNFMPHIVAKASSAAEGLCKWVRAMVSYDEVAKVVAPKKEKLAAAQKECDETEAFLNAKRNTLADLNRKLAALKSTLEATLLKKLQLEKEVESCTNKLRKAESLIASLGGEKARWLDSANKLGKSLDNLPGDALLASTMITYLSPFNFAYREKVTLEFKELLKSCNVPFSDDYDFVRFLGTEIEINTWQLCGLSNNQFSLQNAVIVENSPLWCLFVDPQSQANEWIKSMEKSNNLQVVKLTDSNWMEAIMKNVEIGNPVLLENLEKHIDVSLDYVLRRDVYKIDDAWHVNLGKTELSYKPTFRFYFTTKHYSPNYSAEIFNKVTVTDFLLPSDALRDRLLDIVISRERPELQEKFEKILVENINNKRILEQQENNILHTLTTSSTNILEDEGAIKILDAAKSLAVDLLKRQEATRTSKEELDAFRETYSQFTKYCADLYSTLNVLPNLNHMYRFSLPWFTQLYIKSIETSNRSVIHKKRIDYLKMSSIQNLHQSVHNALLDKHKLIYTFILCAKTLMDTEQITEQEFNVFMNLGGDNFGKRDGEPTNPAPLWLSNKAWIDICKISNAIPAFQNFSTSFTSNISKWKKYSGSIESDEFFMPPPWDNKLTQFQKLMLIRILCSDKIIGKITEFVESVMGQNNSSFVPNNVTRPYAESSCFTPLIFILPTYSSPFSVVNKFAKILGYSAKLHVLSMGPSQEQKAELLIEMAKKNGEWVFLHNCHLVLPWLRKLEKTCEEFSISNTSMGFRLWMSSLSHDQFPIGILQNSIKIAFDFPYDVKQTLTWTYKSEPIRDKEFFEGCPGKDKTFSKLLYGFCLFHAVIRERKYFGCQGWNFQYDFDESDLQMSIIQLKNWINQCDKVPFKALTYFLGECNYGGKIMDIHDKIYLDMLVLDYCNYKVISDSNYDFDTVYAYRVPKRIEYRDYLKHIRNSIPACTSPEDLGLDKNVALVKNNYKVDDFLKSLSCLRETTVITDIESKNNHIKSIIFEILKIIPENFNVNDVQEKYTITETNSLNCVLIEEVKMYNKCLNVIRDSLNELRLAHSGYLIWTEKIEEMSDEISKGLVPKSWKIYISLCTKKLLSKFIPDILERVKFINNWIVNGHPNFYWFGGLMSCKRLLSTMKSTFARQKQVPIDQVAFEFNVLDIKNPIDNFDVPENSICVYGLYLIGARWNEQSKSLSSSKTKMFYNEMPVVCFELTTKKHVNSVNNYKCPMYVSPNLHNSKFNNETILDNYVLSVHLKSDINQKVWVKRCTAMYCQIE